VRAADAITLRSNPGGARGAIGEDLVDADRLVAVEGAALFAVGDEVLLVDLAGPPERARVSQVGPGTLAFRPTSAPNAPLSRPLLAALDARVLKVREVAFSVKKDGTGARVLARKATGQAEQILARHVGELRFDYLDAVGAPIETERIGPGRPPASVVITLALLANPGLPRVVVPTLTLRVPLEPQSAEVAFDASPFHHVGVAAIVGRDAAQAERRAGIHAWRKAGPRS
jgi:hypothetical protein